MGHFNAKRRRFTHSTLRLRSAVWRCVRRVRPISLPIHSLRTRFWAAKPSFHHGTESLLSSDLRMLMCDQASLFTIRIRFSSRACCLLSFSHPFRQPVIIASLHPPIRQTLFILRGRPRFLDSSDSTPKPILKPTNIYLYPQRPHVSKAVSLFLFVIPGDVPFELLATCALLARPPT